MCWNQDISINTFLFACLALLFIFLTNTFTKYKSKTFDNPFVYLFLLVVSFMQMIEFLLWRNLKNKIINERLSKTASFLITLQPMILMFMIPNLTIKYCMLLFYLLFIIVYFEYKLIYNPIHFQTTIGKNGHLSWEWMNFTGYENIWCVIYLSFYILSAILMNDFLLASVIISSVLISLFYLFKYNTFSTIWCWVVNIFLLYFIIDILLIQPYYEYNSLC